MINKRRVLLRCLIVLFIFVLFNINTKTFGATNNIIQYNEELEKVKREEKENIEKLTGVEKELSRYLYDIALIDSEMSSASADLANLQNKTDDLIKKLEENELILKDSDKLYENIMGNYAKRLRAIYENGLPTMFDILVSSKSIDEFFSKMNVYETILKYDRSLVENVQNKKAYLSYIQTNIEQQKLQLDQLKKDVEQSTQKLNATLEEKKTKVGQLESSKSELKANSEILVKKRENALQKIEDEVDRVYRQARQSQMEGTSTEFTGGNFAWPVEGYNVITTTFGFVYYLVRPEGSAHTGCDIAGAGIFGKPIVAIESGTVTVAGYNAGGYGNYVMINHGKCTNDGKNYISLYGHASALAVTKGEHVEKGQVIAYVGSTGNSTGPHLHLELRIDGKITDPLIQYPALKFIYR